MFAPKSRTIDSPFKFGQIEAIAGLLILGNVFIFNKESDINAPVLPNEIKESDIPFFTDWIARNILEDSFDFKTSDGLSSIEIKVSQSIILLDSCNNLNLLIFPVIVFLFPNNKNFKFIFLKRELFSPFRISKVLVSLPNISTDNVKILSKID